MSKTAFYYFLPLCIGAAFFFLGFAVFRRVAREGAAGRMGCLGFALMVGGGVIALAGLITAPTPWERQRRLEAIFHTPPDRIERIVIRPGRPGSFKPLVKSPVIIDDKPRIQRISEILGGAREISPDEPSTIWTAQVHLMTEKETFTFNVTATRGRDTGTIVQVDSSPNGGGWNLGTYRADGLEKILQDAASAAGKRSSD